MYCTLEGKQPAELGLFLKHMDNFTRNSSMSTASKWYFTNKTQMIQINSGQTYNSYSFSMLSSWPTENLGDDLLTAETYGTIDHCNHQVVHSS